MKDILKYLKEKDLELIIDGNFRYLVSNSEKIANYSINDYLSQDGIGNVVNLDSDKKVSEIVKLEVDEKYQGKGYGSLIFNLGVLEILDKKTDYLRILTNNQKVMNNLNNLWERPTYVGESINDYIINLNLRRDGLMIASKIYLVETFDNL